jgi:hypothetical protein
MRRIEVCGNYFQIASHLVHTSSSYLSLHPILLAITYNTPTIRHHPLPEPFPYQYALYSIAIFTEIDPLAVCNTIKS